MALLAVQSATCLAGRPVGRRLLAAGGLPGFAAALIPWARAAGTAPGVPPQGGGPSDDQPPADKPAATPSWERSAVGDGLDPVRERIQQYVFPKEQRLPLVLEALQAEERKWLRQFAEAEAEGDDASMESCQSLWKSNTKKLELLRRDPQEFVRRWGWMYDIEE